MFIFMLLIVFVIRLDAKSVDSYSPTGFRIDFALIGS